MKIIIVGIGKVGYKLAQSLADEKNDVTVIDTDEEALSRASETLDIMCLHGNGVSVATLFEAGVKTVDILIAVTASDEVNMVCCLMGKKLGAKYTVARIRELYYNEELHLLKEELELDLVINPEEAAAVEIIKKLKYPNAVFVESFAHGDVDLVEITIEGDNLISGKSLIEISQLIEPSILIVAVSRGSGVIVPNGNFVIHEGDRVYIIGTPDNINNFCRETSMEKYHEQNIKNIMIIGGGKIARYLAERAKPMGIKVKVIEQNEEASYQFADHLTNGIVIHGDGTDEELLLSENLKDMDAFVAVTGYDEDNLMSSLLAKEHDVPKIITKITRKNYAGIVRKLGITNIVYPMIITANSILKFIRSIQGTYGNYIESLYKVLDNKAEVIEFKINSSFLFVNIPLMELNIKPGVLVATIVRNNQVIIPHGNDIVKIGDHIIIITNELIHTDINNVFLHGGRK